MWPFKKPEPKTLDLNQESYSRFLRAGGVPDLKFFLSLNEEQQETLAEIGDEYREDLAVAQGYAILDPDAAAAGMGQEEAEERVLARLGAALLARSTGEGSPLPSLGLSEAGPYVGGGSEERPREGKRDPLAGVRSPTMGGVSKRRAERDRMRRQERSDSMTFLGKVADPVEVPE
jgi:hypothetical protein